MENLYLLKYDTKCISGPFYYNNGISMTRKEGKIIVDNTVEIKDTYSDISHFLNYDYEFILVENSTVIYLINKHTLEINELGSFTDKIHYITSNNKYTLIVTVKSLILFSNEYFDVICEIDSPGNIEKAEFSTDDTFILIFKDKVVFYNLDMKSLGEYEISCKCACYIERYNYWSIITKDKIYFIEENGYVYNSISYKGIKDVKRCYSYDTVLILVSDVSISLLVLVDGQWQNKHISTLEGEFIDYYKGSIIYKTDYLNYYVINKEYTRVGNLFFVIDYKDVLVYNFDRKKLACHDLKLEFENPIYRILVDREEIGVLLGNELYIFNKDFELIVKKEIDQISNCRNLGICMKDRRIIESLDDMNIHNIDGRIIYVKSNGEIYSKDDNKNVISLYKSSPFTKEYLLSFKDDCLYLLYDNSLFTTKEVIPEVSSYFVSDTLLYTKHDKLIIDNTCIITDINFKVLGTTDLEIYGISRFNSIDTYYNKEYIRRQIVKYFEMEEYTKSIEMMIKHNIKVKMENINVKKLNVLSYKYILYIIDELVNDYKLVLDDEFVYILNKFDINMDFRNTWISRSVLSNSQLIYDSLDNTSDNFLDTISSFVKDRSIKTFSVVTDFIHAMINQFKNDSNILDYILIKCGRVDLAIMYTKDLESCIKLCKNLVSKEEIKRNVVLCYRSKRDLALIEEVCSLINEDIHILRDIECSYHRVLEMYKLFEELIYYLIKNNMNEELTRIIDKYNLHDKLLAYVIILEKPGCRNLLNLYVRGVDINKKILIYKYLECYTNLLDLYVENVMYEEIFNFTCIANLEEYKMRVIDRLDLKKKYKDLGIIYEKYLNDPRKSLVYFVQSGSIRDIYRLYERDGSDINLINVIVNQFDIIEKINKKLKKYVKRLHNIQYDLEDENFSVTSVCRTNRGIPGNLYEYEFYLEKVNELLSKIINWVEESKLILIIKNNMELEELVEETIKDIKLIPDLFNVGYERSKEKVVCVDLTSILN